MVKTHFHKKVKVFRSDNGTEFVNRQMAQLFSEQGIHHQRSCPYSPQQNGVVERKHRTLLNSARALMFHSGLPLKFWPYSLLTATWILNRIPSEVLDWLSPCEVLFKKEPDFSMLRPFGCLAYAMNLSPYRGKFDTRSIKCIFLGYNHSHKGYQLNDLDNHNVFVSRDVKFVHDKFPFASSSCSATDHGDPIPPSFPTAEDTFTYDEIDPDILEDEADDITVEPEPVTDSSTADSSTVDSAPVQPLRRSTRHRNHLFG